MPLIIIARENRSLPQPKVFAKPETQAPVRLLLMGERKLSRVKKPTSAKKIPRISNFRSKDKPSRIGRGDRGVEDFWIEDFFRAVDQVLPRFSPAADFREAGFFVDILAGVLR